MIKYNNSNINDWYFYTSDIIKVYRNGAVVYYKVNTSGETPTFDVCYAVVDDISQYSDTEFVDVYDKATEKWYKLNNLNQYEEYGVYGDSISSGSTSRLPQGYTEVEYVENNTKGAYINTNLLLYDVTGNSFSISAKISSEYYSASGYDDLETLINNESISSPYYGFTYRYAHSTHVLEGSCNPSNSVTFSSTANTDGTSSLTINCNSTTVTDQVPLGLFASYDGNYNTPYRWAYMKLYSFQVTKNNTLVRDLVPCERDSDNMVGLYDLVNDVFYYPPNYNSYQLVAGSAVTPTAATYYQGKLAIVDGYEYQYSGSSWVNVGEVSGSTIETVWLDYPSTNNFNANFDIGHYWGEGYKMVFNTYLSGSYSSDRGSFWRYNEHTPIEFSFYSNGFYYDMHNPTSTSAPNVITSDYSYRILRSSSFRNYENGQIINITLTYGTIKAELEETGAVIMTGSTSVSSQNWYSGLYQASIGTMNNYNRCHLSSIKIYNGNDELVNDLKFVKNQGVTGSQEISLYDSVLNVTYNNTNSYTPVYHIVSESGGTEYPIYYDDKSDPLDNLTFSSMTEANEYAYNNCVYDGLKATIDGTKYIFSGDSQGGYEWVESPSRLPVGYTEVEYIENQNMACIDTGFKPNQDTRIVAEMQAVSSTSWGKYFAVGGYDKTSAVLIDYENGVTGTLHLSWGTATGWTIVSSVVGDYNVHTYDWNKNQVYRDNTLVHTFTYGNFQSTYNLCIFVNSTGNGTYETTQNHYLKGKMYSFKVYDNGTLVRDLVPCIRDNDSKVGAYDIVNSVFYATARDSYQLVAGNPV